MDAQTESSRLTPESGHREDSLHAQVRTAVIWRSGSQIFAQLIQWACTFMVIRILAPADYGLFAMTQVVILLLNMLNGAGLASALIREPELDEHKIRQMFGMLLLVNAVLAAIQFALAPVAAAYYRQPMIATLLHVQCLIYATTPFIAFPYALLSRGMNYRAQAAADIISSVTGALAALGGALAGWGVWTLVWAPIVLFAVRGAGLMITARSWYWPSFDFRGAGHMARYGGLMAAGQIFWFAESQADVFIAGRRFDPHLLGIYTTSLFLAQIFVSKVIPPLNQVAFAAYARLQGDPGAVGRVFPRGVGVIMVAALPFYAGMAATAEPLVLAALGPQWMEAVPIVRILAFAMPFMTFQTLIAPACDAMGRPGLSVKNGATGGVLLVAAYLVGVNWGIQGLALSWLTAYPLYIALSLRRTLPVLGTPLSALVAAVRPPLLAALVMGLAVAGIDHLLPRILPALSPWPKLAVLVPIGGIIYLGWLSIFSREMLLELINTLRKRPASV